MTIARPVVWSGALFCVALVQVLGPGAAAQEDWKSAKPAAAQPANAQPPRQRSSPPHSSSPSSAASVERGELGPIQIMGSDLHGPPDELWRGLDLKTLEQLLAELDLPPRSPALAALWRRLLLSPATPPSGVPSSDHFVALRLEALYRSGLLEDMQTVLSQSGASGSVIDALRARRDIGLGRREAGCQTVKALAQPSANLPGRLKGEAQLLAGYCAALGKNAQGAGLATELAREEGIDAELPLAVLAGFANGTKPQLRLPTRVLLLDYRFLELLGAVDASQVLDKAEPALLVALARHIEVEPRVKVAAAEAALRLNALPGDAVADLYRRSAVAAGAADATAQSDAALRRALFFKAAEVAQTAPQRARLLRALVDDARRSGYFMQIARLIGSLLAELQPSADSAWFAETATEVALASGRYADARSWADSAGLRNWLALIDIADPRHRRNLALAPVEQLAARGRIGADAVHRLVTVLDALDVDVSTALWDAAGRLPQPSAGYLPETGVLADLGQAAKRNELGRTVLLVMRVLGAGGPDGANILGLGDSVRALKRVGLEADARRLALEALLAAWPRAAAN